jgi:hypothetical protein
MKRKSGRLALFDDLPVEVQLDGAVSQPSFYSSNPAIDF